MFEAFQSLHFHSHISKYVFISSKAKLKANMLLRPATSIGWPVRLDFDDTDESHNHVPHSFEVHFTLSFT